MLPCRAIGIIFGDVGTSPLYVFASIFQDPPNHHDLMGATSMIFWTLTLVALIKYVPGFPICIWHAQVRSASLAPRFYLRLACTCLSGRGTRIQTVCIARLMCWREGRMEMQCSFAAST